MVIQNREGHAPTTPCQEIHLSSELETLNSTEVVQCVYYFKVNSVSCFIARHFFVDIFITIDLTVTKFGM